MILQTELKSKQIYQKHFQINALRELQLIKNNVNKEQCKCRYYVENYYVKNSAALATALNPYLSYDKAALLVKESLKKAKSVKGLVLEKWHVKKDRLDKILAPKNLTRRILNY